MKKTAKSILLIAACFASINLYAAKQSRNTQKNGNTQSNDTFTHLMKRDHKTDGRVSAPTDNTFSRLMNDNHVVRGSNGEKALPNNLNNNNPLGNAAAVAAGATGIVNFSSDAANDSTDTAKKILRKLANIGRKNAAKVLQILEKSKLNQDQIKVLVDMAYSMNLENGCNVDNNNTPCTEAEINALLLKAGIQPEDIDTCEIAA